MCGFSATPWTKYFEEMAAVVLAIYPSWWRYDKVMRQMTGQECRDIISVSRETNIRCDGAKAEKVGAVSRDEQVS